jgi:hypothetical protein
MTSLSPLTFETQVGSGVGAPINLTGGAWLRDMPLVFKN